MAIKKALRANVPLLPLSGDAMDTFRDRHCHVGWLAKDSRIYRYGSDETQARWSRGQWVNVTEDLFYFTDEALEKCALLDATFWTMETEREAAEREKAKRKTVMLGSARATGARLPDAWRNPSSEYRTPENQPAPIWNSAAWRATLIALEDVPVYFGVAGPMAFDLSTGKRYRGPGDQTAHRAYPGGATQILISGMDFDRFTFVPPERMQWTRWPQHH
jgi:hypothetical protein